MKVDIYNTDKKYNIIYADPPWRFVLSRIHNQGARTMASLFDGIGGFPKIWQEIGGQTLWASEVEPFCVRVTSRRFEGGINGGMESN